MSEQESQVMQGEEVSSELPPTANDAEIMIKEALAQAKEPPKEEKPTEPAKKGHEFVEISDPAVKERFNNIYKQMKASDETNQVLRQEHGRMSQALETALTKLEAIEQQKAREAEDKEVTLLRGKIRHAKELGNDDEADKLSEALMELKADQKYRQQEAERTKKERQEYERQVQERQSQQTFNPDEVKFVNGLRQEKDTNGEFLRPWMQESDKDFKLAQKMAFSIVHDMEEAGTPLDIESVFKELDNFMFTRRGKHAESKPKTAGHAAVLSGSGNVTPPKDTTIKLSEGQRHAARKLGISESVYAKNLALAARANSVSIDDL